MTHPAVAVYFGGGLGGLGRFFRQPSVVLVFVIVMTRMLRGRTRFVLAIARHRCGCPLQRKDHQQEDE